MLRLGATRLGWDSREVPRWFKYDPQAVGGGRRQSMSETYVPAFTAAGGRLVPEARVKSVERRGKQWIVHGKRNGDYDVPFEIAAETVFVCAGAVQTPAILQRSGIGSNVGRSLRMHPTVKIVAEFADPINDVDAGVPSEQVKEFSPDISFGCSISSPEHLAVALYGFRSVLNDVGARWRRMSTYYAMAQGNRHGYRASVTRVFRSARLVRLSARGRRQATARDAAARRAVVRGGGDRALPGRRRRPDPPFQGRPRRDRPVVRRQPART